MSSMIYLDNAATTRCDEEILQAALPFFEQRFGNPSSRHPLGLDAREALEKARRQVAKAFEVEPDWVIFTASGTEADALAILGSLEASRKKHAITTAIEHPAVLESFALLEQRGFEVTRVGVGASGVVSPEDIFAALRPDTALVSVMHVNNEIGTVQPVEEIGPRLKALAPDVLFHVDAVQSASVLGLDLFRAKIDLLSISGHKIHAPKGVGALLARPKTRLTPRIPGGGQENGRRGGTENVAFAVALGAALTRAVKERAEVSARVLRLKERLVEGIRQDIPEVLCNGDSARWSPAHASLSFPGVKAEVLQNALFARGVLVSAGAACSSRKKEISHVLRAIGHPPDGERGTLRFSLSRETTEEEIERTRKAVSEAFGAVRKGRP